MLPVRIFLIYGFVICLSGCATQSFTPAIVKSGLSSDIAKNGTYALNSDELDLSCNKLKGRIQLRVLEVRDRSLKQNPTLLSTYLQQTAGNMQQIVNNFQTDSTNKTGDTAASQERDNIDTVQDLAVLTAYNQRLGQLGCDQYDILTELDLEKSEDWQIK